MRLRTTICDLFEIEYPILLAGMGGAAGPELAAAVSNAGGMGVLGAAGCPPDVLDEWIARTRKLTDKPFGVDTLLPASVPQSLAALAPSSGGEFDPMSLIPAEVIEARDRFMREHQLTAPEPPDGEAAALAVPEAAGPRAPRRRGGLVGDFFKAQLDVVLDNRVPLYVAGLGDPGQEFVDQAHELGMKVMVVAGNTRHAQKALGSGVDAVVAQGTDGGGHNSPIGTLALIPQVVDTVSPLPVIGAGGIADGRGVAAAFVLGARGVWLGTLFLATDEAHLPSHQKQAILDATERDTIVSRSVTGKPARMIRGSWADVFERGEIKALPMPLQSFVSGPVTAAATVRQRADVWPGFAGQSVGLVKRIRPAAEVVEDIVAQTVAILDGMTTLPGVEAVLR
jgi:NAD(P)H-dependent flavin oxidoreductase YrpB (nitropropane dioxygenase family)